MKSKGTVSKEIDWAWFKKLCSMCCTKKEIASAFEMSDRNLLKRCEAKFGKGFSELYDEYSADGKISVRRKQYEVAMEGNVPMLIWWGKQYLGQRDMKDEGEKAITEVKVTMHPDTIPNGNISEVGLRSETVAS